MDKATTYLLGLALAATLVGGCSPSDQFWTKPDFGERFTSIEAATRQAASVRNLDLYNRNVQGFPEGVLALPNLERLGLRLNPIGLVPASIARLSKLSWLDVGQAGLSQVDPALGRLPALRTLYLNDNALTALPATLAEASHLVYLNLDRNKLTSLPDELGRLQSLTWLRLNGNQIKALPADLSGWTKGLKRLYLRGNPLPDAEKERIRKALPNCDIVF